MVHQRPGRVVVQRPGGEGEPLRRARVQVQPLPQPRPGGRRALCGRGTAAVDLADHPMQHRVGRAHQPVQLDGVLEQVRAGHRPQLTGGTRRRHRAELLDRGPQPLDRSRHRVGDRRLGCL